MKSTTIFATVLFVFSFHTSNAKQKNLPDTIPGRQLWMNWDVAVGQTFLTSNSLPGNRSSSEFQPVSFHYNATLSIPFSKHHNNFGVRTGLGPRILSVGINSQLRFENDELVFVPLSASPGSVTSTLQQFFIDVPLRIYYTSAPDKRGKFFTAEIGGLISFQTVNWWKNYQHSGAFLNITKLENISILNPVQLGTTARVCWELQGPKMTWGVFLQGSYYPTRFFRSPGMNGIQSYDIKIGIQTRTLSGLIRRSVLN
jgi:hypothetical protein